MDGIGILLKALGIEVNADEVKQAVSQAQILIPKIAQSFDEMNARLKRIEDRLVGLSPTDTAIESVQVERTLVNGTI